MNNIYNAIQNLYNMDKTTWQEVLAELYNLVSKVENKLDEICIDTEKIIKDV